MPKYYVESGELQLVIHAKNPRGAALWALHRTMSYTFPFLDNGEDRDDLTAFSARLDESIRVNEQGFGRSDALVFKTFPLVVQWSQLLIALETLEAELESRPDQTTIEHDDTD